MSVPTCKTQSTALTAYSQSTVLGAVAISIAILVLTDDKLPASEVFGKITDGSGWHSTGFSYLIGYLSIAWSFTDYDATVRLCYMVLVDMVSHTRRRT